MDNLCTDVERPQDLGHPMVFRAARIRSRQRSAVEVLNLGVQRDGVVADSATGDAEGSRAIFLRHAAQPFGASIHGRGNG